jgi:DNA-binding MarR family transcriptional regulator
MTRLSDLKESPGYQLWVATNRWQRFLRRALAPIGLTHVQYIVLVIVWRLRDTMPHVTQAAVSKLGELDANMASQVIRSLVEKGLLVRRPHPKDGRAVSLELTEDGADCVEKARAAVTPLIDEFFEPLGKDQENLARMLSRLNEDDRVIP